MVAGAKAHERPTKQNSAKETQVPRHQEIRLERAELNKMTLEQLQSRAVQSHGEVQKLLQDAVRIAIRVGEVLRAIQLLIGRGAWGEWVKDKAKWPASEETARVYKQIAKHREAIEARLDAGETLTIDAVRRWLRKPLAANRDGLTTLTEHASRARKELEREFKRLLRRLPDEQLHFLACEEHGLPAFARECLRLVERVRPAAQAVADAERAWQAADDDTQRTSHLLQLRERLHEVAKDPGFTSEQRQQALAQLTASPLRRVYQRQLKEYGFAHPEEPRGARIYYSSMPAAVLTDPMGARVVTDSKAGVLLSFGTPEFKASNEVPDRLSSVHSVMVDSGAFSLASKSIAYYDTAEFRTHLDAYAAFLKNPSFRVDCYVNLDVISSPDLTWRHQQYLEKEHGLKPMPVVHYPEDPVWLKKYLTHGYDMIGLGGLVGKASQEDCKRWLDACFDRICDSPDRLPPVKIHGFGVTSIPLLSRYPFYSVDSKTWLDVAARGKILVPQRRQGAFRLKLQAHDAYVDGGDRERRYLTLRVGEPAVAEWLALIGMPVGKMHRNESAGTTTNDYVAGVSNDYNKRRVANIVYFEMLREVLPAYPRPWQPTGLPTA